MRLRHKCFSMNFAKFSRISILVTFTEKNFNGTLHFLCSVDSRDGMSCCTTRNAPPKIFSWEFSTIYSAAAFLNTSGWLFPISRSISIGVTIKRCSENKRQIYRRTPMTKSGFNKVVLKFYWNHTSG